MLAGVAALPVAASGASARSDIALLREILTALHPGLYRYASPSAIDEGLSQLDQSWETEPSLAVRYLNLSRFLATIQCGHSYANFFNQKKAVREQLFDRGSRLPFAFRWIDREMVVLQDQSGTGRLSRGAIVKTINDIPAKSMLERLMPYARADGGNDGKRRALLSMSGADEYETFDIFHGLIYGAPKDGIHRLLIRSPGAKNDITLELPALTLAQRQAFIRKTSNDSDAPVWDWTMRDDGIAVLRMDGWALYNSKWDWQTWLSDRIDNLNGAKGLVVDIRENEGGLDCGDTILARLTGKDIVRPRANRLVRYLKTPTALNPYLDTWDDSFRDWSGQSERFNDRFYRLRRDSDPPVAAKGPAMQVPMAVLTSAQNSSATFQFAELTRKSGLGVLVGETTGGNRRGINGGAFFFARLPQSGIEFDVPLIGYFPVERKPDSGIEPDIRVRMTAAAIAAGDDPQIEAALRYLLRR